VDSPDNARELLMRHSARYDVSPYFVMLDVRTFGLPATQRKIHAGFDLNLYGNGFHDPPMHSIGNGELRATLSELSAACRDVVSQAKENCTIEIIPFEATLVLDVKRHFEPEALVRIRITHSRGLDQPAGASEEKALADVIAGLHSLGVKKN
jgi:hypothetical protein